MGSIIEFTHANTKRTVCIVASQVFTYFHSENHASVYIMATGGAIVPVSESIEEVTKKLKEVKDGNLQKENAG